MVKFSGMAANLDFELAGGLHRRRRLFANVELEQKRGPKWSAGYAIAALGFGDEEQANNWLERSYEAKEAFALLLYIKIEPLLTPLHSNPRFDALANKMCRPIQTSKTGMR